MAKKAVWGTIVGAIAAAAVAFAVPAAAGTAGQAVAAGPSAAVSSASPGTAAVDKTALCDRLRKHEQQRQAVQTRLSADANTRGSIAWLTAKAASATASGNDALAKLYTDKAALRSQLLDPLKTVTADLDALIQANCN